MNVPNVPPPPAAPIVVVPATPTTTTASTSSAAAAPPEVSTPILDVTSGRYKLSTTTTSKAKHMLKQWTIRNWSGVARIPGSILYDREFLFANHRWRWRLYPGGVSDNVGDNVSLYLDCRDATEDHPAYECHTFRILNHHDRKKDYKQKSLPYKEHKDPDGWGWGKFISHSILMEKKPGIKSDYLTGDNDDTIILELDLTVYDQNGEHETTDVDPNRKVGNIDVPASTLADDFGHLFEEETFADITFIVPGSNPEPHRFKAHRAVLAVRSPVLAGQFKSGMTDSLVDEIHVDPEITAEIFREVLRFVYTGDVEQSILKSDPTNLLAAADRYGLTRLKTKCEHALWDMLDVDNASWILLAADRHSATKLRSYCLEWISKNAQKVLETESFGNLTSSDPQLVVEILRVTSDPQGDAQKSIMKKRKRVAELRDQEDNDDAMPPPQATKKRRSSRRKT